MNVTNVSTVLGMALLASTCTSSDSMTITYSVRDSAGIRVATNGPIDAEGVTLVRLANEPLVDVGVVEGAEEYRLFRVADAQLEDDKLLAVNEHGRIADCQENGVAGWGSPEGYPQKFMQPDTPTFDRGSDELGP